MSGWESDEEIGSLRLSVTHSVEVSFLESNELSPIQKNRHYFAHRNNVIRDTPPCSPALSPLQHVEDQRRTSLWDCASTGRGPRLSSTAIGGGFLIPDTPFSSAKNLKKQKTSSQTPSTRHPGHQRQQERSRKNLAHVYGDAIAPARCILESDSESESESDRYIPYYNTFKTVRVS